jgi:hypothetical protein
MEKDRFDPVGYIRLRLTNLENKERILFPLQRLHEEFARLPGSLKILEYGAGPVIMNVISAAPHASEITLAEYSIRNRDVLSSWLEGTFDDFDWSPIFDYVVRDLEGKTAEEARERERLLRSVVKKVVACDYTASPMIEEGNEGPYDVIVSSCCISCCPTMAQYKMNLKRLTAMVKPGGTIMLVQSERRMRNESGVYYAGSTPFRLINATADFLGSLLEGHGFRDVRSYSCPGDPEAMKRYQDEDLIGFMFVSGVKSSA